MASVFRDRLLAGKNAFVTGGGSGIGQRMAERFAEHGANVMLVGRKQEKLDAAASAIRSSGGTAATASLDVRDYPAVEAALQKTRDQFGEIDILVCGAAGNFPAPVLGMSANGIQERHRYRSARNVQHLPGRLRASAQTGRQHHQYLGQPRLHPDRASGARLRREGRRRSSDANLGHRMGTGGHSRQLHHARSHR